MKNTITVTSSNGTITIHPTTGEVIEINDESEDQCISNIVKFDLLEFRTYYNYPTGVELPSPIDILDLGLWDKEGNYGAPEQDWRNEFRTRNFHSDNPSPTKFMQRQTAQPTHPLAYCGNHVRFFAELMDDKCRIDAIEIHPLAYCGKLDNGEQCWDICDAADAQIWGVYTHYMDKEGIECIADCDTEEAANQLATILELTGKLFYK